MAEQDRDHGDASIPIGDFLPLQPQAWTPDDPYYRFKTDGLDEAVFSWNDLCRLAKEARWWLDTHPPRERKVSSD